MEDAAFVGSGIAAAAVRRYVDRVAPSDASVLLMGETGTGKDVVARLLHDKSRRAGRPFVAINCAALPAALVESELFGHEKGAFSGADRRRDGLFAAASTGTLFLDEIGEMPLELQPKLLRALEQRCFLPIGGRERHFDARIIAATNMSLSAAVARGGFRADLYFRLSVAPLVLPPLRERPDDIPELVRHLQPALGFSRAALDALCRYDWPGNVRELRNCIERLALFADAPTISGAEVAAALPDVKPSDRSLAEDLRAYEIRRISDALWTSRSGIAGAARTLAVKRTTLSARIRALGVTNRMQEAAE